MPQPAGPPLRISVCLPTMNSRPVLERRVDSLLAQTYPHWEVVNVDTRSSDGTVEYLRERLPADRFRSLQNPPGLYDAWNRAIAESDGDCIHFATADDFEEPTFYERCVEALQSTGADIASTQYRAVDPQGRTRYRGCQHPVYKAFYGWEQGRRTLRPRESHFFYTLFFMYPAVVCNGSLFRREAFNRAGGFPTEFGPVGDWGWWLRAALHCDTCTIDDELAAWTISDAGATTSYARFSRYRPELQMQVEMLRNLRQTDAYRQLDRRQRRRVEAFIDSAEEILSESGLRFYARLLLEQPDKLVHAFSKRRRLNCLPFWITRLREAKLLSTLSFEQRRA